LKKQVFQIRKFFLKKITFAPLPFSKKKMFKINIKIIHNENENKNIEKYDKKNIKTIKPIKKPQLLS
jgi:hypothetical protein